jgi:hypothetical protein
MEPPVEVASVQRIASGYRALQSYYRAPDYEATVGDALRVIILVHRWRYGHSLPLFLFTLRSGFSQSQTMSTLSKYVEKNINIQNIISVLQESP